jgi:hypothetical protein
VAAMRRTSGVGRGDRALCSITACAASTDSRARVDEAGIV